MLNLERSKIKEQEASCHGGYQSGCAEVRERNIQGIILGVSPPWGIVRNEKDKAHFDEGIIPKDSGAAPDAFDVNAPDWYSRL